MKPRHLIDIELGLLDWTLASSEEESIEVVDGIYDLYKEVQRECEVEWLPRTLWELEISDAWVIQAVADCSNCLAKVRSEEFYALKDWCITVLTAKHKEVLSISWSWDMPMITSDTKEMGVSCYHCPTLWIEDWADLPASKEWSGIRRQMSAINVVKDDQLRRVVAYATRHSLGGSDPLAVRVNALLEESGKRIIPLP